MIAHILTKYYWAVLTFWRDRDKMLAKITIKSHNNPTNTQKYFLFITLNTNDLNRLVIFKITLINDFIHFLTYFSTIIDTFCGKLLLLTNGDNGVIIGHTLGLTVTV